VKYGHIESLRQRHPVAALCRVRNVSESGYHAWRRRPPSARAREEIRLETQIAAAHQRTRETCGPERLQADLSDHGVQVGLHRIKRIRKKLGLRCKQKRKFKATTDSKHNLPVAPNLLDRQFAVTAPNKAWVTDITYVATDEGWLYLAGVKDLFNGELVGYATSERMARMAHRRGHTKLLEQLLVIVSAVLAGAIAVMEQPRRRPFRRGRPEQCLYEAAKATAGTMPRWKASGEP
jgi:putative transposase